MFGYQIEPNFDIEREKRRDHVGWALLIVVGLSIVYDLFAGPNSTEVFQFLLATTWFYGATFYADRKVDIGKGLIRKDVLASLPLHAAYLVALVALDRTFPRAMMKAVVFIPVLAVGFVFESLLFDWLARRFTVISH